MIELCCKAPLTILYFVISNIQPKLAKDWKCPAFCRPYYFIYLFDHLTAMTVHNHRPAHLILRGLITLIAPDITPPPAFVFWVHPTAPSMIACNTQISPFYGLHRQTAKSLSQIRLFSWESFPNPFRGLQLHTFYKNWSIFTSHKSHLC